MAREGIAMMAILLALIAGSAFAAPAPPEMLVKNSTKECMAFNAGDECTSCKMPPGWTSLGYMTSECPEGFSEVARNYTCAPGRNQRCCSEGHSGSMGNCEEMLINDKTQRCAFSSANCTPSDDWKAGDPLNGGTQCPMDFSWVESACASGPASAGCPMAISVLGAVFCLAIASNTCFNT